VFAHYQEIRLRIDEQREELKKRIDGIAISMIDQVNKCEESLLKNLIEKFSLAKRVNHLKRN
jgi:hypothetical protein